MGKGAFKKLLKAIKSAAKAAWKAAKKLASIVCDAALRVLAAAMRGVCIGVMAAARATLIAAQHTVNIARIAMEKATAIMRIIQQKVIYVIKLVTDFGVNKIGFSAKSAGGFTVALFVEMVLFGKVKPFRFSFNFKQVAKLVGKLCVMAFKPITDAVKNAVNGLKTKVKKLFKKLKRL